MVEQEILKESGRVEDKRRNIMKFPDFNAENALGPALYTYISRQPSMITIIGTGGTIASDLGDCLADCRDAYLDCVDDCREYCPGDPDCYDACSADRDTCDDICELLYG